MCKKKKKNRVRKESAPGNHSNSRRALHTYDQSFHWSVALAQCSAAPLPIQTSSSIRPAWNELYTHTHTTSFLHSLNWLSEWLTDSLTQTAGDSVYPPVFNIIRAPTLLCSSLKTGHLSVFLFCLTLIPCLGSKLTLWHSCQCGVNWDNLPVINSSLWPFYFIHKYLSKSKYIHIEIIWNKTIQINT